MAKETFLVSSEEGAAYASSDLAPVEVGAEVELELTREQRTALIAAGWLEEKKGGKK